MRSLLISCLLLLAIIGCRKVIDVDLNDANPVAVIEATMVAGQSDFTAKITRTGSYFANEDNPAVTDAIIMITDNEGQSATLTHVGDGYYTAAGYQGVAGKTYSLTIQDGENLYTASSYLPPLVHIDSIHYEFQPGNIFSDSGYVVEVVFNDPLAMDNYYRIYYAKNGEYRTLSEDLLLFDDQLTNGNLLEIPLFGESWQAGDTVTVELRSIPKSLYDYYSTLQEIITNNGGGNVAAPANPNTNITGGALGYFGTLSADTLTVVIQ